MSVLEISIIRSLNSQFSVSQSASESVGLQQVMDKQKEMGEEESQVKRRRTRASSRKMASAASGENIDVSTVEETTTTNTTTTITDSKSSRTFTLTSRTTVAVPSDSHDCHTAAQPCNLDFGMTNLYGVFTAARGGNKTNCNRYGNVTLEVHQTSATTLVSDATIELMPSTPSCLVHKMLAGAVGVVSTMASAAVKGSSSTGPPPPLPPAIAPVSQMPTTSRAPPPAATTAAARAPAAIVQSAFEQERVIIGLSSSIQPLCEYLDLEVIYADLVMVRMLSLLFIFFRLISDMFFHFKARVISTDDVEMLRQASPYTIERRRRFCELILQRGPRAYRALLLALIRSQQWLLLMQLAQYLTIAAPVKMVDQSTTTDDLVVEEEEDPDQQLDRIIQLLKDQAPAENHMSTANDP